MTSSTAFLLSFLLAFSCLPFSRAFVYKSTNQRSKTCLHYIDDHVHAMLATTTMPSLQQVSNDCFTDQTYHASSLVNSLVASLERSDRLQDLVAAQLSHNDGIRGFLAVYLARSAADVGVMPGTLSRAIRQVDMEQLAPILCMNVITPTAMAIAHKDRLLQQNARTMAHRAKKILANLSDDKDHVVHVVQNIQAVHKVASQGVASSSSNPQLEEFWSAVFRESGYDERQLQAIAAAFDSFVQP